MNEISKGFLLFTFVGRSNWLTGICNYWQPWTSTCRNTNHKPVCWTILWKPSLRWGAFLHTCHYDQLDYQKDLLLVLNTVLKFFNVQSSVCSFSTQTLFSWIWTVLVFTAHIEVTHTVIVVSGPGWGDQKWRCWVTSDLQTSSFHQPIPVQNSTRQIHTHKQEHP